MLLTGRLEGEATVEQMALSAIHTVELITCQTCSARLCLSGATVHAILGQSSYLLVWL